VRMIEGRHFEKLVAFQIAKFNIISSAFSKKNLTLGYLGENDLDPDLLIFVFSNLIFRIVEFDSPISFF
jgi:hypothetical protein